MIPSSGPAPQPRHDSLRFHHHHHHRPSRSQEAYCLDDIIFQIFQAANPHHNSDSAPKPQVVIGGGPSSSQLPPTSLGSRLLGENGANAEAELVSAIKKQNENRSSVLATLPSRDLSILTSTSTMTLEPASDVVAIAASRLASAPVRSTAALALILSLPVLVTIAYWIFIYPFCVSPLRHIPGPKVSQHTSSFGRTTVLL